ncbi:hypothetical protein TorRG33x02_356670 [Trema orientale]|uniref:Uncharacterized protein n=1 Tax=Trema orientale TaxID=63057 RepID=A0A2P5A6S5_TREOI|nr:hypothetical protein TorRG33x02_356670 [Trema orientale]
MLTSPWPQVGGLRSYSTIMQIGEGYRKYRASVLPWFSSNSAVSSRNLKNKVEAEEANHKQF